MALIIISNHIIIFIGLFLLYEKWRNNSNFIIPEWRAGGGTEEYGQQEKAVAPTKEENNDEELQSRVEAKAAS